MTFTEANTVEQMILDCVAPKRGGKPLKAHEDTPGWGDSLSGEFKPTRWDYMSDTRACACTAWRSLLRTEDGGRRAEG